MFLFCHWKLSRGEATTFFGIQTLILRLLNIVHMLHLICVQYKFNAAALCWLLIVVIRTTNVAFLFAE